MCEWMTTEQMCGWKLALELRLRRLSGVAFQDFFADVMTSVHGDDFVATRPRGALGDRGCDGFLASAGTVFACYGKQDDSSPAVQSILAKMDDDYAKAGRFLGDDMKEWHFVHNMMDGAPTDAAVLKIGEMRRADPGITFGTFAKAGFEKAVFGLPEATIIALIGMAASAEDTRNMRLQVVADLLDGIIAAVEAAPFPLSMDPKAVPKDKLDFNALPRHWHHVILSQTVNARLVADYLGRHHDIERGDRIAEIFNRRYKALKEQGLGPADVMTGLYEGVVGIGTVTNERAVAAQAVLAFLFNACDIFEDKPVGAAR